MLVTASGRTARTGRETKEGAATVAGVQPRGGVATRFCSWTYLEKRPYGEVLTRDGNGKLGPGQILDEMSPTCTTCTRRRTSGTAGLTSRAAGSVEYAATRGDRGCGFDAAGLRAGGIEDRGFGTGERRLRRGKRVVGTGEEAGEAKGAGTEKVMWSAGAGMSMETSWRSLTI